ncbi:beta-mannosidase isoform X2 [Hyla sarda]|uniref:beta-mannosidase isoform X2 n=1 Tax=Hyla sarda TaxID=327740 RepID=UPI0024C43E0F|nr:beta-mannosidase isoform X2 [Hyla sarda]
MAMSSVMEPGGLLLFFGLLQVSCGAPFFNQSSVLVFSLNGQWAICNSNRSLQLHGAVPGCVHSTLFSCGIIKDPYIGFNDVNYNWIVQDEWTYSKTFILPPEIRHWQKVNLVCEGIDTISTIVLNNVSIAKTQNMFSRYTVDISKVVKEKNYIEIKIESAVDWAKEKSTQHAYPIPPDCPPKVQNGECHVNFIRKAQCSFSWDWGPSFPTQGIWKDIRIEAYNLVHLKYISYTSVFDKTTSQWSVVVEPVFDSVSMNVLPAHVVIRIPEIQVDQSHDLSIIPGQQAYEIIIKIYKNTSIDLWWPNGYGFQTHYNMSVTFHFEGEYIIEKNTKVWQDFMFACSLYPTDDWFLDTVREEVIHQIRRLKSHPCIIVWSGNNENEAAIASDWFSIPSYMKEIYVKDYLTLYIKTIRELVLAMDMTRPFIASSPTNGKETEEEEWLSRNPYDNHYGDVHYYNYMTDCWNWTSYPKPRLASEYGFQSWPSFSTIHKVSSPEDWSYSSNFSTHRQHHDSGNEQMIFQAGLHYKMPKNIDPMKQFHDTLYLTQVMQAQCVKLQTEFYRRSQSEIVNGQGFTMGALYWQLNDIWQAPSWSSIEYNGKWKMLHYYAKDFFAPVAASAFEYQDTLNVYGVSDLLKNLSFKLVITVYKWDSLVPVCERVTDEFILKSRTSKLIYKESIPELLSRCGNTTRQQSVVVFYLLHNENISGSKNWHFLSSLKEAQGLLKSNITVSISIEEAAFVFTLISSSPSAFVWLDVWDISGRFSDNGFLLIAEKTVVYFYAWEPTTIDDLKKSLHISTIQDIYQ